MQELDRLVQEDMALGCEIEKLDQAFDARLHLLKQKTQEGIAPIKEALAPLRAKRKVLRDAIFAIWERKYTNKVTLDLPSAKVSRRNYRELVIEDKEALLDALDRADRLDLVDYVFDEKALARLITKGQIISNAARVIDHYNLQVRPVQTQKDASYAKRISAET